MAINTFKFTQDDKRTYDIVKNYGSLKFMGLTMENVVNEDTGEIVGEVPSHVEVYSEKEDSILSFKIIGDVTKCVKLALGTPIEVVGTSSLHIYSYKQETGSTFTDESGEVKNRTVTAYGFSVRIDGYKALEHAKKPIESGKSEQK